MPASLRQAEAMRVLVTRPQPQADDWVSLLCARGIDAVALPLIEIAAAPDARAVAAAWASLPSRSLVVFVSPNAAERFIAERPHGPLGRRCCRPPRSGPERRMRCALPASPR